ncbi:hypothetical protein [Flavobacterium lindanitolerans]|uniref:Uncharacterized protein n=1 Tax=Flavobacterium lindanitolerans TaxID=428988 RepID=A0A497U8D3_9FLAO|nr:hypothetical protein [Flavobacterium lindanitolerans]MBC8644671.1 hypothetical protein [Flavobacterium lindanitolerans]PKW20523.1 hypothetical protein B0G92_2671 [Flavobacterium lindanitolerans]RLJ23966.1 hypothetical protein CLV50_2681 [Flavobacterium lindanitolerans]
MTQWLNNKYGTNFNEQQLEHIKNFSLMWNVFEGKICNTHFTITQFSQELANRNIDVNLFQKHFDYFKNRYTDNGAINNRFQFLYFRPNDRRTLVEDVLLGNNTNPNDIILAITIIVFRFRNNLFHGLKEFQNIDNQNENFEIANDFLSILIDNF